MKSVQIDYAQIEVQTNYALAGDTKTLLIMEKVRSFAFAKALLQTLLPYYVMT